MQSKLAAMSWMPAQATLALTLFLLPVLQFLDANVYFKFRYGFAVGHLALIVVLFAVVPFLLYSALAVYGIRRRTSGPLQFLFVLSVLLFIAQLYSTTLYARPVWVRLGVPFALLALSLPIVLKRHREVAFGLSLLSIVVAPYAGYQLGRHWWRIPKPPSEPRVAPMPLPENPSDLYIFFLDGCTLTSANLDENHYPQGEHLPNLHRFTSRDAHWFYNAVSNGASTSASLPSIFTGKLYSCRANNYLANEETIFSILESRYEVRGYLHTKSHFCGGDSYELCYPFREQSYAQPMRILIESYLFLSSFRLTPLSYEIGEFDESSYTREAFVADFLHAVGEDQRGPRFYTIQLFDRELKGLKQFDTLFGEFVDLLERQGRYENSIIVILADHGFNVVGSKLSYGEGAAQTRQLFRVPFAIKSPGRGEGRIYSYPAQGIDITPTILALVLDEDEDRQRTYDGVNVLKERPRREHYINRLDPESVYRFDDLEAPEPRLLAVPVADIQLRSNAR